MPAKAFGNEPDTSWSGEEEQESIRPITASPLNKIDINLNLLIFLSYLTSLASV
jgi:hypothetical protein